MGVSNRGKAPRQRSRPRRPVLPLPCASVRDRVGTTPRGIANLYAPRGTSQSRVFRARLPLFRPSACSTVRFAMSEIPKTYEPAAIEGKWYADWEKKGCFAADPASSKPAYSIVIPPPNVTGVLTLGHVLNNTIQDILARRARMTG